MTPSAKAAERWYLMSRHGECAEVATLKRRVPDIGELNDPHAFAAFMRNQGHEVTIAPTVLPKGKAYEVNVPKKELALVFVTQELCNGIAKR